MFSHFKKYISSYLSVLAALSLSGLWGCASTGSPGGGLYDETPPVLKKSTPEVGETGVKDTKITLRFDENIKLDKAMDKMTVSPPQAKQPTIRSNAKTVVIELQDTLIPNATYTIDLADAVQDNNEGNPLEGLTITFSTGDHIDSLQVSGYVLNAANLEPVTGAYVGIYNDTTSLGDSVLINVPMERAGRTDDYGKFTIHGIASGKYRIYALIDGNTNFKYDLNSENIAFLDSLIVPSSIGHIVYDTIWTNQDSTTIDTIMSRGEILYLPNDIILRTFNEGKSNKYLDDYSRPDSCHINIRFATEMPELPTIRVVDSLESPIELIVEPNPTCDTLSYWIKDDIHIKMDTLRLQMSYLYTDTAGIDILRTDTLRFVNPVVKTTIKGKNANKTNDNDKKDKKDKKKRGKKDLPENEELPTDTLPQIKYMTIKLASGNSLDIGAKPVIEMSAPVDSIDLGGIHLEIKKDTIWTEMPFSLQQDSIKIRRYTMYADPHFSPGCAYQIRVDSAAIHDIYGCPVNTTKMEFKEKTTEEYAHLLFEITGTTAPSYVELLNEKDIAIYKAIVKEGKAKFVNVKEGTYYARLIEDSNNNGKFDPGNLSQHIQPEMVYYFNAELKLRTNWDLMQSWDIHQVNLAKQKPDKIKTNKPKQKAEKKSKNAEYMAKMGKTPKQTNTGTTTTTVTSSKLQPVNRNR